MNDKPNLSAALFEEWLARVDAMELLFEVCVELGDPVHAALGATRALKRELEILESELHPTRLEIVK